MNRLEKGQVSRRERQILDILYRLEQGTAKEVQENLPDPPSYSAVRALLATLEGKDMVSHLQMSSYGTRDAANNWQEEVARTIKAWGFIQGAYNLCLYYNSKWDIAILVHGDDFVSAGNEVNLRAIRTK